jgi:hypothetical protein
MHQLEVNCKSSSLIVPKKKVDNPAATREKRYDATAKRGAIKQGPPGCNKKIKNGCYSYKNHTDRSTSGAGAKRDPRTLESNRGARINKM